jgi:hypothetical protein
VLWCLPPLCRARAQADNPPLRRILNRAAPTLSCMQADNPLRRILNRAADEFLAHLPIVYVLTVVGRRANGELALR